MAINFKEYTKTKHTGVSVHKDGLKFLLTIKVNDMLYRKTFKSNTNHGKADRLKTAYKAREAFLTAKEHELNITADIDATVGDYWVKVKKLKGWSDTMVKDYDQYFNRNLVQFRNMKLNRVKKSDFTNLNARLSEGGFSTRTKAKAYEILKPIFELALEDEVILKNPIDKKLVPRRNQAEEKKIISNAKDKFKLVHEAIMSVFRDNPHHRAGFLFGLYGRRSGETFKIRWEDINFEDDTYIIRGHTSKVNSDMEFSLPKDLKEALLEFRDVKGKVFNVNKLDKHYYKIRTYTGLNEFTFHWMRNLNVSALAGRGASTADLSATLGHTSASTINKYLSLQRVESTKRTNNMLSDLLDI